MNLEPSVFRRVNINLNSNSVPKLLRDDITVVRKDLVKVFKWQVSVKLLDLCVTLRKRQAFFLDFIILDLRLVQRVQVEIVHIPARKLVRDLVLEHVHGLGL